MPPPAGRQIQSEGQTPSFSSPAPQLMLVQVLNGLGGQNDASPAQSASVVQGAPQGASLGSIAGVPP